MRTFNELNGRNQGVYLVRKMIEKRYIRNKDIAENTNYVISISKAIEEQNGLLVAHDICSDLLDIATLGEIEESSIKPIGKQICTDVREVFGDYD